MVKLNNRTGAVALAVAAMLGLCADQAFAGFVVLGQENVPDSWRIDMSASVGNAGLLTEFDTIKAFIGNAVTYTVSGTTYSIPTPSRFEDISASSGHYAIQDFGIRFPTATSTWAQTYIDATPYGTELTASGNTISAAGQILDFSLYFEGEETDGTHVYVEFYNGDSFVTGYEIKNIQVTGATNPNGFEQINYFKPASVVPLPSASWLGGLGLLGGLGVAALRRRRNNRLLA